MESWPLRRAGRDSCFQGCFRGDTRRQFSPVLGARLSLSSCLLLEILRWQPLPSSCPCQCQGRASYLSPLEGLPCRLCMACLLEKAPSGCWGLRDSLFPAFPSLSSLCAVCVPEGGGIAGLFTARRPPFLPQTVNWL